MQAISSDILKLVEFPVCFCMSICIHLDYVCTRTVSHIIAVGCEIVLRHITYCGAAAAWWFGISLCDPATGGPGLIPRQRCLLLFPLARKFTHIAPVNSAVSIGECEATPVVVFLEQETSLTLLQPTQLYNGYLVLAGEGKSWTRCKLVICSNINLIQKTPLV